MKTKELIAMLHAADPEGEHECVVNNVDIYTIDVEPAYWDGCMRILKRDPKAKPYYDIIGMKFTSEGTKVNIVPMDYDDVLGNNIDAPIEYEGEPWVRKNYQKNVEECRKEFKEFDQRLKENKDAKSSDES